MKSFKKKKNTEEVHFKGRAKVTEVQVSDNFSTDDTLVSRRWYNCKKSRKYWVPFT